MSSLTIQQAAGQLDALVDAALAGDEIVLSKNGRAVQLVPVEVIGPARIDGEQTGWSELLKDFVGKAKGLPTDMAKNHDHYLHGAPKK